MNAIETRKLALELLLSGKVKNHKIRNATPRHSGENENIERQEYKKFIRSKNCYMILDGKESIYFG